MSNETVIVQYISGGQTDGQT